MGGGLYVRVMDRRPPPAPARAWAMLSPCWAVDVAGAIVWERNELEKMG